MEMNRLNSYYCHSFCNVDFVSEAKYLAAATILGFLIVYMGLRFEQYLPNMDRVSLPRATVLERMLPAAGPSSHDHRQPYPHITLYNRWRDTSRRVSFDIPNTYIYGYPSKGGVIALANPTIPDFEFLRLSRTHPPAARFPDAKDEDDFCKRLLLLGAKWYDSLARMKFVKGLEGDEPDAACIEALEEEREPAPTEQERTWVSVAWPREGAIVVAEWDTSMWGYGKDDDDERDLPEEQLGRLRVCKDMDEKAFILKKWFEGRELRGVDEYVGSALMGKWEQKENGDHGKMQDTWKGEE